MSYTEACKYTPWGAQLFSKIPNLYSNNFPYSFKKCCGIEIETNNNQILKDFSTMGIGSCLLGYANPVVNKSVIFAIEEGSMSSLNNQYEIPLFKKIQNYEPNKLYRIARTGGEAMAIAVRLLRSYTGNDIILTNGYNGWHDWYLAGNINGGIKNHLNINNDSGVPRKLSGTCYYFDTKESFLKIINNIGQYGNIAGIVLEMARYKDIDNDLLNAVIESGYKIIVDEITTGWRANLGGYYTNFKIKPDIVVYGKAISNGFPFSIVCGEEDIMRTDTFISSTYWTESIGTVAALETIKLLEKLEHEHYISREKILRKAVESKFGKTDGFDGMIHYYPKNRTRWIDFMLEKGYLVTDQIYLSFAHTIYDINKFIEAMNEYQE